MSEIVNRGSGAGGSNTNETGLKFEKESEMSKYIKENIFSFDLGYIINSIIYLVSQILTILLIMPHELAKEQRFGLFVTVIVALIYLRHLEDNSSISATTKRFVYETIEFIGAVAYFIIWIYLYSELLKDNIESEFKDMYDIGLMALFFGSTIAIYQFSKNRRSKYDNMINFVAYALSIILGSLYIIYGINLIRELELMVRIAFTVMLLIIMGIVIYCRKAKSSYEINLWIFVVIASLYLNGTRMLDTYEVIEDKY